MYRLGIIGCGLYGARLARIFADAAKTGRIDFCAAADIDGAALDSAARKYGVRGYADYRDMIRAEKLDAVAIVTPDHLHEEIAVYAAENKLHMLVQKPLDTTAAGARRIVDAANRNGVLLYVDFHKRFDPGFIQIKDQNARGVYGQLLYGYLNIEDVIEYPSVAFKKWVHLSSPAWFIGIHLVDVLNWALGRAPADVSAVGHKKKLAGMGLDTYDSISARLRYADGLTITIDSSWVLPNAFPSAVNQNVRLVGTDGFIEIDGQDRGVQYWSSVEKSVINNPYGFYEAYNRLTECGLSGYTVDSVLYYIKLLQKLDGGAALAELDGSYPNGGEAVLATRIVEAIHESAQANGAVIVI